MPRRNWFRGCGWRIWSPDCKVHVAYMWPTWGRQDPGGLHVGPMNFAIRVCYNTEIETSFRWHFHHFLYRKLSFWQHLVQPEMKMLSRWHLHFRVCCWLRVWTCFANELFNQCLSQSHWSLTKGSRLRFRLPLWPYKICFVILIKTIVVTTTTISFIVFKSIYNALTDNHNFVFLYWNRIFVFLYWNYLIIQHMLNKDSCLNGKQCVSLLSCSAYHCKTPNQTCSSMMQILAP